MSEKVDLNGWEVPSVSLAVHCGEWIVEFAKHDAHQAEMLCEEVKRSTGPITIFNSWEVGSGFLELEFGDPRRDTLASLPFSRWPMYCSCYWSTARLQRGVEEWQARRYQELHKLAVSERQVVTMHEEPSSVIVQAPTDSHLLVHTRPKSYRRPREHHIG